MTIVDHGVPVSTSRQDTTALSPNPTNTGWNYVVASFDGAVGAPVEWVVVSDLTTSPSQAIYDGTTHIYPNTLFQYTNQLRAGNGRIFFPLFGPETAYYDPADAQVHQLGPIVETPPVDPNASTIFYSASFDVAGFLYFGTQESHNRPACLVRTDPATLAQTIIGYVGDGATGYTTYAYRIAPDTVTASKWIYTAYGESSWQLWATDIATGIGTKLYEVTSTGNIQFVDITGKGWVAIIDTALGSPSNVRTEWWCLDGAIYAYSGGSPPVAARNVTPASNPLVSPPDLDVSGGVGVVGWRAGSSGPFTYVNYTVLYTNPVMIESLVESSPNDGIVGNAQQYSGFFQYTKATNSLVWYGPWVNNAVSQGPRLNVDGTIYIAGYPNGVLLAYDPAAAWDVNPIDVNPELLGYYGLNGTQFAGIKYATALAWSAIPGASGRLYCVGSRQRNGNGAGIGSWDKGSGAFAGTYTAPGMVDVLPTGVLVLEGLSQVIMATVNLSGVGSAPLYLFDYDLNYVGQVTPLAGHATLGLIVKTSTPNVIAGIVQGSGNSLGLYQYNVQTQTLVTYTEIGIIGVLGTSCQQFGGAVWIMSDDNLVRVNVDALTAAVTDDLSSIAPVNKMGFASDGHTLFFAAGSPNGVDGAQLYSTDTGTSIACSMGVGIGVGFDIAFIVGGDIVLDAQVGVGVGAGGGMAFLFEGSPPSIGATTIALQSNEAGTITRGQPVYSDTNGTVRLACADGSGESMVTGVVTSASIVQGDIGLIALGGVVAATPAEWDEICGTTGGLTFNTTYYLHPIVPGRYTTTPPSASGTEFVCVLRGLSSTQAKISITPPIYL